MIKFDHHRKARIGLPESVFCEPKSAAMLDEIIAQLTKNTGHPTLFTRLDEAKYAALDPALAARMDYHPLSRTAYLNGVHHDEGPGRIVIITAGTSDLPVAWEALRTLQHLGLQGTLIPDVGVAGIWRLEERLEEINAHEVIIAVAGMDGAMISVIGGLSSRPVIGVPTSVGYGVSAQGTTALNSMLTSCSPGVVVVNIDNGYGAACAASRVLRGVRHVPE